MAVFYSMNAIGPRTSTLRVVPLQLRRAPLSWSCKKSFQTPGFFSTPRLCYVWGGVLLYGCLVYYRFLPSISLGNTDISCFYALVVKGLVFLPYLIQYQEQKYDNAVECSTRMI